MIENTPPAIHSATICASLPVAPATIDGVPKMPAPTMRPTIMAIASKRLSVGRGTACSGAALTLLLHVVAGLAHLGRCGELRAPRDLARRRALADADGAA